MKKELKQLAIVLIASAFLGIGIGAIMDNYRLDWFKSDADIRTELLSTWYSNNEDCRPAKSASIIDCGNGKYIIHAKLDNGKFLRLVGEYGELYVKVRGKIL